MMHSLEEILKNAIGEDKNRCQAIEKGGVVCYNKKAKNSKYCCKHASRLRRFKQLELPKKIKACKILNCENKYYASGYCGKHYEQYKRKNTIKKCDIKDCFKTCFGKRKYCSMHQLRLYKYGCIEGNGIKRGIAGIMNIKSLNKQMPKKEYKECIARQCINNSSNNRITKGLCRTHYSRWLRYKDYNIASKKEFLEKQRSAQCH